ncbi:MAG: hypothetical protein A2V67_04110 [Deltaproteobacteria bacterium RBG_13_61_14]|nr:MAG: hypothetical protein A2V67_04110 [Deltaproteobacteria bacterium RBG_13_61_14]
MTKLELQTEIIALLYENRELEQTASGRSFRLRCEVKPWINVSWSSGQRFFHFERYPPPWCCPHCFSTNFGLELNLRTGVVTFVCLDCGEPFQIVQSQEL